MQTIQLREYEPCRISAPLDGQQLDALRQARVEVRPAGASGTEWELRPSSYIGAVRCGELNIIIRPKIPIDCVMFLVSYALNPGDWRPAPFSLAPDDGTPGGDNPRLRASRPRSCPAQTAPRLPHR